MGVHPSSAGSGRRDRNSGVAQGCTLAVGMRHRSQSIRDSRLRGVLKGLNGHMQGLLGRL